MLCLCLQPTPTSKFLQGYVGAVTSAVSIAVSFMSFSGIDSDRCVVVVKCNNGSVQVAVQDHYIKGKSKSQL